MASQADIGAGVCSFCWITTIFDIGLCSGYTLHTPGGLRWFKVHKKTDRFRFYFKHFKSVLAQLLALKLFSGHSLEF